MTRPLRLSRFGERFARPSGASLLMRDIGEAAGNPAARLLGGGNPARIASVEQVFCDQLRAVAADPAAFGRFAACYAGPEGDVGFRVALAQVLSGELGATLTERNIALTAGSQSAFFMLFNLLAGAAAGDELRQIVLPIVPEYIGYCDLGLDPRSFRPFRPRIELLADNLFKYRLDTEAITVGFGDAAVCVSRPTNPTGNVLTDAEMTLLAARARAAGVPLIVDAAYGLPFPGIVFTSAAPFWNDSTVLCLSLSKLGLPAVRTGIVVASEEIVEALGSMSAILGLAPPSTGPVLVERLLRSGELQRLAAQHIRPFYAARVSQALEWCHEALRGSDYRIHRPEGAFFLWLWLPSLNVSTLELYQRLKARGVFVVPGEYFFPGLAEGEWSHQSQCLRLSYAQDPQAVRDGIRILGEEVKKVQR